MAMPLYFGRNSQMWQSPKIMTMNIKKTDWHEMLRLHSLYNRQAAQIEAEKVGIEIEDSFFGTGQRPFLFT